MTYALEREPHSIWRGQTLMRCGPAYGLDAQMDVATPVRRVFQETSGAEHAIEHRMRFPLPR